ncbi:hypothetical protein C8R47DRAFT_1193445 [Mycena vitilis]|nr:hypothetical protein C8R47DRAFT_1193445 [Mycena vitilis]
MDASVSASKDPMAPASSYVSPQDESSLMLTGERPAKVDTGFAASVLGETCSWPTSHSYSQTESYTSAAASRPDSSKLRYCLPTITHPQVPASRSFPSHGNPTTLHMGVNVNTPPRLLLPRPVPLENDSDNWGSRSALSWDWPLSPTLNELGFIPDSDATQRQNEEKHRCVNLSELVHPQQPAADAATALRIYSLASSSASVRKHTLSQTTEGRGTATEKPGMFFGSFSRDPSGEHEHDTLDTKCDEWEDVDRANEADIRSSELPSDVDDNDNFDTGRSMASTTHLRSSKRNVEKDRVGVEVRALSQQTKNTGSAAQALMHFIRLANGRVGADACLLSPRQTANATELDGHVWSKLAGAKNWNGSGIAVVPPSRDSFEGFGLGLLEVVLLWCGKQLLEMERAPSRTRSFGVEVAMELAEPVGRYDLQIEEFSEMALVTRAES